MSAPAPLHEEARPSRRFLGAEPDPPRRGLLARAARRVGRELVLPFVVLLDLGRRFGARLLGAEYELAGQCHQRGACCHHVLLEWSPLFERFPLLGRLALWKLTRFYSFYDRGYTWEIEEGLMARVLGCHALRADGRCGEYRLRPLFCRTYPEIPLVGRPGLLKGCGYAFARRDGRPDTGDELVQLNRRALGGGPKAGGAGPDGVEPSAGTDPPS